MEIRINKLRLQNFKGVRSAEYDFHCANARIEGPNGSGKSTVFDAFTWLLFGKDHRGQSTEAFELKTIDPVTGKPIPRLEHYVEAELTVDGMPKTLRRVWTENWVKPTGETEEVMRGHNSEFLVDGVNVGTKKAYDAVISGWMGEDMFKMLTNPHFLIDDDFTNWKNRRAAIMSLVKDAPGRAQVKQDFSDVVDAMCGTSIEQYRKRLATERNANKRDMDMLQNQIKGIREGLPVEVDEAVVNGKIAQLEADSAREIEGLKSKLAAIDKDIASGGSTDTKRQDENKAIWAEITRVQLWMSNAIAEAKKAATEKNNQIAMELSDARTKLAIASKALSDVNARQEGLQQQRTDLVTRKGKAASDLARLGIDYENEKKRVFEYTPQTTCPYCGQEIPAASIQEAEAKAKEHFLSERKSAMDKIIEKAKIIRNDAAKIDAEMSDVERLLAVCKADFETASMDKEKWQAEVQRLSALTPINLYEVERQKREELEFRKAAVKEQDLRVKANATAQKVEDSDELLKEKAELERQVSAARASLTMAVQPLRDSLAANKVRKEQLGLIAKKEQEAARFADAISKNERQEARAEAFVKAEIESVESAIAGLFTVARWKMFDRTLDGGIVEMCEVTSPDGVPYRSMNDAMKILCGLDVIRVFSERYGMKAPIFIDNAESIIQSAFPTSAQVIRLVVKDNEGITLINE